MDPPYKLLAIGDASHASSKTSYAMEGRLVLRCSDSGPCPDKRQLQADGRSFNGVAHLLLHSGKKAKRISHSTSHAESLTHHAVVSNAELVAMRLTELSNWWSYPYKDDLVAADECSKFFVPIDTMSDCIAWAYSSS